MQSDIISRIRKDLDLNADAGVRQSAQRFFKEEVRLYGVKSALVSNIESKAYRELKGKGKREILELCEELLKSDYYEESYIAFNWAYRLRESYEPDDFGTFEKWLEGYVNNWAKCDTLCNHAVGSFIERYPEYIRFLKGWARSDNRWVRRASAVTLILPARKGAFLTHIFEISDLLLKDADDLVQKGYGWMLKEASKAHQDEVFEYIMKNRKGMPRTALRYAIEKMPKELKTRAMER